MAKHDWTISKQIGRTCLKCESYKEAMEMSYEFGGYTQMIAGYWYNVWPQEIQSAGLDEKPYIFDTSSIR
jgi:hypothetical protein